MKTFNAFVMIDIARVFMFSACGGDAQQQPAKTEDISTKGLYLEFNSTV